MEKLKYMSWDEGHLDGKIKHYKEYLTSDLQQFPKLNEIPRELLLPKCKKIFFPVHILELRHDGE